MRLATVVLVTLLVLTSASAWAQPQTQPTDNSSLTIRQKLDQYRRLRVRFNQQIQNFNADFERMGTETQVLKQFSSPYLVEFQRRNEEIQHNPDVIVRPENTKQGITKRHITTAK